MQREEPGSELQDHDTRSIEPASVAGPWHLEIAGDEEICSLALKNGERVVIGSGPGSDVRLRDRWVSARHVQLQVSECGLSVKDLGSANGIFVGNAMVRAARLTAPYSSFVIGRTTICANPEAPCAPLEKPREIPGLIGRSTKMLQLAAEIHRFAPLSAATLVRGETGTGKDIVAKALHALAGRDGEYVALNIGGLGETLADGELFGHRRGAFTGAVSSRAGAFELAHQGTLFLDEIAEMCLHVQVKLLRVLEDGRVRPLGSERTTNVQTRVVSATWKDLELLSEREHFRCDLFHRLSRLTLDLPPLRQRRSDIPVLSSHLLARHASEVGDKELSSGALSRLLSYHWPGNVRELEATLYRAALVTHERVITLRDLERALPSRIAKKAVLTADQAARLLDAHNGNVSSAARAAHVPRSTFRSWLAKTAGTTAQRERPEFRSAQ